MENKKLFECGIADDPMKRICDEFSEQVKDECTVAELKTLVSVVHALGTKEIEYCNSKHVPIIGICGNAAKHLCDVNTFDYENVIIMPERLMERAGLTEGTYTFKKEDFEWFMKHFKFVTDWNFVEDGNSVKYVATIRPEFHEDENNE